MSANPALAMWKQILGDPWFHDVPYKVETTSSGAIMMSPASNWHGNAQVEIALCLDKGRKGGKIINECSILTTDGVKVADVAWASDEFIGKYGFKTPYTVAPEICVEIVSPGNTQQEIEHKVDLYLAKGALEVWVVRENGGIEFSDRTGRLKKSAMVKTVKIRKLA